MKAAQNTMRIGTLYGGAPGGLLRTSFCIKRPNCSTRGECWLFVNLGKYLSYRYSPYHKGNKFINVF